MTRNTLTIYLKGGLGNQMFQYAATKGIASLIDKEVQIDKSFYNFNKDWPYQLDLFNIPQNIFTPIIKQSETQFKAANLINKLFSNRNLPNPINPSKYLETSFHFDETIFDKERLANINTIEGYFQSSKYFTHIAPEIRSKFQPKAELSDTAQQWLKKIKDSKVSVSLHVRRGDYLNTEAAKVHCGFDIEYYKKAVKLLQEIYPKDLKFFLFSDDHDYLAKEFSFIKNSEIVKGDPKRPYEEMFLMAACNHNIIANSSFSWWGAWLNNNTDKKVIAPFYWFTKEFQIKNNPIDIYEKDWIILK